ncbi:type I restriction endonuclease subunit R [Paulownia witches'-broom phytoplasma]|uniref:type I site-specific deoxyribonuclease n=1 Tax=Paulownia witches'-broom phytoplasma TaxID=39647 RepID=A0ABX8TSA3_9MOLU|nr:type I restriction endonuclease subunit R [Paulownia witches'-broom phytoplasma]
MVILINGIPMVLIELKKRSLDKGLDKAFKQVEDYSPKLKQQGLLKCIELFIISNGTDTQYFSNQDAGKSKELNKFRFEWSDENNNKRNEIMEFIPEFLQRCHLALFLFFFLVHHEKNQKLMVAKPHQFHAIKKIVEFTKKRNNPRKPFKCYK